MFSFGVKQKIRTQWYFMKIKGDLFFKKKKNSALIRAHQIVGPNSLPSKSDRLELAEHYFDSWSIRRSTAARSGNLRQAIGIEYTRT
jgi:hypothetical protein